MKGFKYKKIINQILSNLILIHKLSNIFCVFLYINIIFISGCTALKKNEEINICSSIKIPCVQSTEYVVLITNKGKIKLELYGKLAPVTVGNFLDYVEKGAYDNTIFNRVIKKPFPFIIRGGDNSQVKGKNNFIDEETGKVRYIPLEIKLKANNLPTYGIEIDISNQKNVVELKHKRSYLSMARSKQLNSASYQFFISLKSLPELDGRYAVFGQVIRGMNVVELIKEGDFIVKAIKL